MLNKNDWRDNCIEKSRYYYDQRIRN